MTVGVAMARVAGLILAGTWLALVALAFAAAVTTAPNGLAFTAVAERAGSRWAGRALGVQNSFQNLVASVGAPPLALVIGAAGGGPAGYGLAFAVVVAFPFLAAAVIPARGEAAVT